MWVKINRHYVKNIAEIPGVNRRGEKETHFEVRIRVGGLIHQKQFDTREKAEEYRDALRRAFSRANNSSRPDGHITGSIPRRGLQSVNTSEDVFPSATGQPAVAEVDDAQSALVRPGPTSTRVTGSYVRGIAVQHWVDRQGRPQIRYATRVTKDGDVYTRVFKTPEEAEDFIESVKGRPGRLPIARWDEQEMTQHLRQILHAAKERAKDSGVEFSLTFSKLYGMLKNAAGRCAITGIPFSFEKSQAHHKRPWVPSVDRITAGGPYSASNCRLVCSVVNYAMNEWGISALYRVADALLLGELYAARDFRLANGRRRGPSAAEQPVHLP